MTQTLALLLDSYRELNAKRLFWVVLALSGLVVAVFASLGLTGGSVTLLGWTTPIHSSLLSFITPAVFYKRMFVTFGVEIWLSWLAAILALISTAGMFPDLMAGGSIDLYLSKPISRPRLFLTKVLGGLLFVTLQVTVFCLCCFALLRARGGTWEPGVFVAIPLVVLMFSYLFAVCVLLGVLTRSTIAALLLTLLFWAITWAAQRSEALLQLAETMNQQRAATLDRRIAATEAELGTLRDAPAATSPTADPRQSGGSWLGDLFGGGSPHSHRQLESNLTDLREERRRFPDGRFATAHAVLAAVVAPLPKTSGTIEVLERQLIQLSDLPPVTPPAESDADLVGPPDGPPPGGRGGRRRGGGAYEDRQLDVQLRQRSAAWILGSSAAFEALVLALAGWLFCRRDY